MIRPLRLEDKQAFIDLMELFILERMGEFRLEFDAENASENFDALFRLPHTVVLVAENEDGHIFGAIAGIIGPMLFCKSLCLQELVWYIKPEYRGLSIGIKLIKTFEMVARDRGCDQVMMVGMGCDNANEFYPKDGYKLLQQSYLKEL